MQIYILFIVLNRIFKVNHFCSFFLCSFHTYFLFHLFQCLQKKNKNKTTTNIKTINKHKNDDDFNFLVFFFPFFKQNTLSLPEEEDEDS